MQCIYMYMYGYEQWISVFPFCYFRSLTNLWLWFLCTVKNFYNLFFPRQTQRRLIFCTLWKVIPASLVCLALNVKGLALDYTGFALQRTRLSQILATMQMQLCSVHFLSPETRKIYLCHLSMAEAGVADFCSRLWYKYIFTVLVDIIPQV